MLSDAEAMQVTRSFFEDTFGCVVGCGCWTRDWDKPENIAQYVASSRAQARRVDQEVPDPPSVALAALEHVLARAQVLHGSVGEAGLELRFATAQALRDFFEPARERLEAAILAAP